jgi:hypothetical protein
MENNLTIFVIIIFILIIIISIALLLFFKPTQTSGTTGATGPTTQFANYDYFGPVSGTTGERGICTVYTFGGSIQNSTAIPGIPSLDYNTLNSCVNTNPGATGPTGAIGNCTFNQNTINLQNCVDPDQISAKLQTHVCSPNGMIGTSGLKCRNYDGTIANPGDVVPIYTGCGLAPCTTTLASVALNFNFDPDFRVMLQNMRCIYPQFVGGTGPTGATGIQGKYTIFAAPCDFSSKQQWRVQRANLNASGVGFTQNTNGPYAFILDRNTNQCIVPDLQGVTGATGPNFIPPPGTPLTLGNCNNSVYQFLLNAPIQLGDLTIPQQISYVSKAVPLNTQADILNYLNNFSPKSMLEDPTTHKVLLQNFGLNSTTQSKYSANYLDYALFNFILRNSLLYPL